MKNRFKNLGWHRHGERRGCPIGSAKAGQEGLLWLAEETAAATGCPIDFQAAAEFPVLPEGRTDQGEEAGEAMRPPAQVSTEPQQHVGQQGGPDLPLDGAFAVPQEVGQLEGLFEFLEEDFDRPAAAIKIGDGLGAPGDVVGQENHFTQFAVHFDHGGEAAQFNGINFLPRRVGQGNQVVAEDVALGAVLELADDAALKVVFGAGDPKDLPCRQIGQMVEVHRRLVKDDDFTRVDTGAKLASPLGFMLGGGVHDGAAGEEGLQVEAEMALGGGLAPTMFGPVQGTGHQLNGGGIHDLDEALETESEFRAAVAAEGGLQGLQMIQHGPEELFGHFRVAGAMGVGQRVFRRGRGGAQRRQRAGVKAQRVADVVEPQTVGQLGVKQTDDMAPGSELAPLFFHAGVARQFGHQMRRNEVANLAQQGELAGGWLGCGFLFHALPCGRVQTRKPTFFIPSNPHPMSQQCSRFMKTFNISGLASIAFMLTACITGLAESTNNSSTVSAADIAWNEVQLTRIPPKPPLGRNKQAPTSEQMASYYTQLSAGAIVAAEKAKDFYKRFPDSTNAITAKKWNV
jgi:hypothetical protein